MVLAEKIIFFSGTLSAIIAILAVVAKIYKYIRNEEIWRAEKDEHDKENYRSILRLTITQTNMPLSERISAGDKYIALGGNGAVKRLYEELLQGIHDNTPPN